MNHCKLFDYLSQKEKELWNCQVETIPLRAWGEKILPRLPSHPHIEKWKNNWFFIYLCMSNCMEHGTMLSGIVWEPLKKMMVRNLIGLIYLPFTWQIIFKSISWQWYCFLYFLYFFCYFIMLSAQSRWT